ncbi:MAG: VOC family protein [Pseudomonadota bacterium]
MNGEAPPDAPRVTPFGPVVQIAYHAPDIARAAGEWRARGAGPFFLMEHIALSRCVVHGKPAAFDHSSAYGQCGDVMIELIRQNDDAPSPVRDLFDARTPGLHHLAVFVPTLDDALADAEARGMACALDATTQTGVRFAMVDARADYGCMLEFYARDAALDRFYAFVKRKAAGWDGADPLRVLTA